MERIITLTLNVTVDGDTTETNVEDTINEALGEAYWGTWTVGRATVESVRETDGVNTEREQALQERFPNATLIKVEEVDKRAMNAFLVDLDGEKIWIRSCRDS